MLKARKPIADVLKCISHPHFGAMADLVKLGKPVVPELINCLLDKNNGTGRRYIADVLGQIGDRSATPALVTATTDDDHWVRYYSIEALGKLRDVHAMATLVRVLLEGAGNDPAHAARALGAIGDTRAIGPLLAGLKHKNKYVRNDCKNALEEIDPNWRKTEAARKGDTTFVPPPTPPQEPDEKPVGFIARLRALISPDDNTRLIQAARNGKVPEVKRLLAAGANLNHEAANGFNALSAAATAGHKDVVEALISSGADVNQVVLGRSPLHFAIESGQKEVAKSLIAHGASPKVLDSRQRTPLQIAVEVGNDAIVQLLLKQGVDLKEFRLGQSEPLTIAIEANNVAITQLLLQHGADPNTRAMGGTLLHLLASNTNTQIAKLLISAGADVNRRGYAGNSPLHLAAMMLNLRYMKLLEKSGADLEAKNDAGQTPMDALATKLATTLNPGWAARRQWEALIQKISGPR